LNKVRIQPTPDLEGGNQMRSNQLKGVPILIVVLLLAATSVAAQTISGSLAGTVIDIKGGAIPGAQVQITSLSRRETKATQTDQDGRFVFPQLTPDTYQLSVEAKGFKGFKLENLTLMRTTKSLLRKLISNPALSRKA
jgi:hypothetical protein